MDLGPFPGAEHIFPKVNPVRFPITYVPMSDWWTGTYEACDGTIVTVFFFCVGGLDPGWCIRGEIPGNPTAINLACSDVFTCDPFHVVLTSFTGITFTVEEDEDCPAVTYDCVDFVCVDPGDGSGAYGTLAACESACTIPITYNCVDGDCVDPGDGTGTYATAEECAAAPCGDPPTWNCIDFECVDPGDGSGDFGRLSVCEEACSPPPPPADCPTVLAAAPDTLYLTTSSTCTSVDGLAVTVSRTSSTTFSGTTSVADCGGCNTVTVDVSCDGDAYVVTVDWTGSEFGACEEEAELPFDCPSDSMSVFSTTPLYIIGRHCFGAMGTGPCCPAGHFDWVLSETPP